MTDRKRGVKNLLVLREVKQKRRFVGDIRLRFNDGKSLTSIDALTCEGIIKVYGKLNRENQRKFVGMLGKSKSSFFTLANWTWQNLSLKTA